MSCINQPSNLSKYLSRIEDICRDQVFSRAKILEPMAQLAYCLIQNFSKKRLFSKLTCISSSSFKNFFENNLGNF